MCFNSLYECDEFDISVHIYEIFLLIVYMYVCVYSGLPSKTPEEEQKHKKLYKTMVEDAKRKGTFSFGTFQTTLFVNITSVQVS